MAGMAGGKAEDEGDVRARLLHSAAELFSTKGYAGTTVREIVERAGVTKPAMYYYFRSKEGIYLDLMRKPLEGFLEAIEAAAGKKGCAWDRIVGVCLGAYDYFMRHLPQARIMYSIYYGPPQGAPFIDFDSVQLRFPETILRLVEEGIRGGEFRQGDPADMAWAVTGAVSVAMELELSARGPGIGRSLGSGGIRRMLGVIFDGIAGSGHRDTGKGEKG